MECILVSLLHPKAAPAQFNFTVRCCAPGTLDQSRECHYRMPVFGTKMLRFPTLLAGCLAHDERLHDIRQQPLHAWLRLLALAGASVGIEYAVTIEGEGPVDGTR